MTSSLTCCVNVAELWQPVLAGRWKTFRRDVNDIIHPQLSAEVSCCDDTGSGRDDKPIYGGFIVLKSSSMGCASTSDDRLAGAAFAGAAILKRSNATCVNVVYVPAKDRIVKKTYYSAGWKLFHNFRVEHPTFNPPRNVSFYPNTDTGLFGFIPPFISGLNMECYLIQLFCQHSQNVMK